MIGIVVMEFRAPTDLSGNLTWPPYKTTRLVSPVSYVTDSATVAIVITSDANTRMSWDGVAPTNGDVPILSAVPNQFSLQSNSIAPAGAVLVLRFQ